MAKVGNISFKLVCVEFARQDGKAKREYQKRIEGFYTPEYQERYEASRKARIAAYIGEFSTYGKPAPIPSGIPTSENLPKLSFAELLALTSKL